MRAKRHKLKAEINVVPYVDVMLVLLIIFMITAPLLHVGVDIKLPQAAAKSLNNDKEPVLVSLDKNGQLYLTLGSGKREPIDEAALVVKVAAFERQNPDVPVQFAGDKGIDYGRVMEVMTELQKAGVPNVGLMTQPDTNARSGDG